MWLMLAIVFLILILPGMALAKGGGSTTTVDQTGPKSQNLQNLENSFYAAVNPIIAAYSGMPTVIPGVSAAAAPSTTTTKKKKSTSGSSSDDVGARVELTGRGGSSRTPEAIASNGKGPTTYTPSLNMVNGVPQPYDNNTLAGQLFNNATRQTYAANDRYNDLMAQSPDMLRAAQTAGDDWYAKAADAYDTAQSSVKYARDIDQYYGEVAKDQLGRAAQVANTGEIPEVIANALRAETDRGLKNSIGSSLASLASRGVLNSSVTNKGLADTARAAGDAYNRNYLDAYNTVLGGYQGNASTAGNVGSQLASTALDVYNNAQGLGQSLANVGSMRTGDLLNVHNANLAERQSLMSDLGQYYQNAAAPMMPAYDFLQTMLQDHWNSNKKDTIVQQGGGGCFITSAACDYFEKPDDCYELTTLRDYRDMWLKLQPGGEELVGDYYEMAPGIVERLDGSPNKDAIYAGLWEDYILPCVRLIEAREYESCREKYIEMVNYLREAV